MPFLRLLGANRRYVETHLPHVGLLLQPSLDAVIDAAQVLVVGHGGADVAERLVARCHEDQTVIDLAHLPLRGRCAARIEGLCW